ncbi:MAG TPA: PAS domain S-box protein [Chloroflexia bacterium]|nr:PAS domain S-box protein [Chloroflexia bacterium]
MAYGAFDGPEAVATGGTRQAAEQLRDVEERFRAVWENAGDAMALSDPDGTVLAANPAYLQLYGYSAEEVVGRNFAVIFPPEVREWANSEYRRTFADPVIAPSVDATIRRKDGTTRVVDSRYTFITRDGERIAMISIVRDITERVQMEQRLRASEERFRVALSKSPVVVSTQDADLRYTWVYNPNPAFVPDLALGKTDADFLPPDEAADLTEIKSRVLATGENLRREVVTTIHGQRYFYDLIVEPVRDADGRIVGVTCAAIDITDRKHAEEERARLLEREKQAHAKARQAVMMRDQVLSTVAHDLRNPLTSIKGYAQILRNRVLRDKRSGSTGAQTSAATHPLEQLLAGLSQIDEAVNRMNGLINELLDTAQLQVGRPLDLNRAPTDLVELAREAAEACRQSSARHTVDLQARVPRLVGEWDRQRLRRAVDNLLSNAVKYSPEGGAVVCTVSYEHDDPETGWAVLTVEDHGIGIPAADLPHIFDWFYRAGNAPANIGGSGIGLAGAHHIAQQHGGALTVESEEGSGASFMLRLPL